MSQPVLNPNAIALLNNLGDLYAQSQSPDSGLWVFDQTTILISNPSEEETWSVPVEGTENEYVVAPSEEIRGRITSLWYSEKEKGTRWYMKVESGPHTVIVQSPHKRTFSMTMLSGIAAMTVEQLKQPINIVCKGNIERRGTDEEGRTHYCNFWIDGTQVPAARVDKSKINPVARIAQQKVAQANGYVYTPGGGRGQTAQAPQQEASVPDDVPM